VRSPTKHRFNLTDTTFSSLALLSSLQWKYYLIKFMTLKFSTFAISQFQRRSRIIQVFLKNLVIKHMWLIINAYKPKLFGNFLNKGLCSTPSSYRNTKDAPSSTSLPSPPPPIFTEMHHSGVLWVTQLHFETKFNSTYHYTCPPFFFLKSKRKYNFYSEKKIQTNEQGHAKFEMGVPVVPRPPLQMKFLGYDFNVWNSNHLKFIRRLRQM